MILVGGEGGGSTARAVGLVVKDGLMKMEVLMAAARHLFAITAFSVLDIMRRLNKND